MDVINVYEGFQGCLRGRILHRLLEDCQGFLECFRRFKGVFADLGRFEGVSGVIQRIFKGIS